MYRRSSRPKRRAPTAAQVAASEKAWNEALGSVEGRFAKGALVADYQGFVWKTTRAGRRYHEDVGTMLYPVVPSRAPKEFAASERLRAAIRRVLEEGHRDECPVPRGDGHVVWADKQPNSYATPETIELRGTVLVACRPVYDDAPRVAWLEDRALAREVAKALEVSPTAAHLPRVHVKPRGEYAAALAVTRFLQELSE